MCVDGCCSDCYVIVVEWIKTTSCVTSSSSSSSSSSLSASASQLEIACAVINVLEALLLSTLPPV